MPYTNTSAVTDFTSLASTLDTLLAQFNADGAAHLSQTRNELQAMRNTVTAILNRYRATTVAGATSYVNPLNLS